MTKRDGEDNVLRVDFSRKAARQRKRQDETRNGPSGRLPGWLIGLGFLTLVIVIALLRG